MWFSYSYKAYEFRARWGPVGFELEVYLVTAEHLVIRVTAATDSG